MTTPARQDAAQYDPSPIGVFDSGVGGLTVLHALRRTLPGESFLYLGDTARLPYGTKSAATVQRYALQAARILVDRGVKALVIACNTASAVALEALAAHYAPLPVFGVVGPGAVAAAATGSRRVVVLGTESTISGGAYQRALLALRPTLAVYGRACPLLVALAEEGRHTGPIVDLVVRDYLAGVLAGVVEPAGAGAPHTAEDGATVLLGCTHFPVFRRAIVAALGTAAAYVPIVDSAATTAAAVAAEFAAGRVRGVPPQGPAPRITLIATDGAARFQRIGHFFLDEPIDAVQLVDL
ncbi:MAG: glutamate racemase [Pseudomonadales bacterium]|nr:glutamate racemase [Pseudomonadales bacterium]